MEVQKPELFRLIENSDMTGLRRFFETLPDLTPMYHETYNGHSAMCYCATLHDYECMKVLLEFGFSPGQMNIAEVTPLIIACAFNNNQIASLLIESGANVHHKDLEQWSPFTMACYMGSMECVRLLISNGCTPNIRGKYFMTPLIYSAGSGNYDLAKELIEIGCELNETDAFGNTAFIWAAIHGRLSVLQLLADAGADVNHQGWGRNTALMRSVENRYYNITQFLLSLPNLNPNEMNSDGESALFFAIRNDDIRHVELLLTSDTRASSVRNDSKTPLMVAASKGNVAIVRLLLQYGAKVSHRDFDNCTAIFYASKVGNYESVEIMLNHSTCKEAQTSDKSALIEAVVENHPLCVSLLMRHNYGILLVDKDKNTPLHYCLMLKRTEISLIILSFRSSFKMCFIENKRHQSIPIMDEENTFKVLDKIHVSWSLHTSDPNGIVKFSKSRSTSTQVAKRFNLLETITEVICDSTQRTPCKLALIVDGYENDANRNVRDTLNKLLINYVDTLQQHGVKNHPKLSFYQATRMKEYYLAYFSFLLHFLFFGLFTVLVGPESPTYLSTLPLFIAFPSLFLILLTKLIHSDFLSSYLLRTQYETHKWRTFVRIFLYYYFKFTKTYPVRPLITPLSPNVLLHVYEDIDIIGTKKIKGRQKKPTHQECLNVSSANQKKYPFLIFMCIFNDYIKFVEDKCGTFLSRAVVSHSLFVSPRPDKPIPRYSPIRIIRRITQAVSFSKIHHIFIVVLCAIFILFIICKLSFNADFLIKYPISMVLLSLIIVIVSFYLLLVLPYVYHILYYTIWPHHSLALTLLHEAFQKHIHQRNETEKADFLLENMPLFNLLNLIVVKHTSLIRKMNLPLLLASRNIYMLDFSSMTDIGVLSKTLDMLDVVFFHQNLRCNARRHGARGKDPGLICLLNQSLKNFDIPVLQDQSFKIISNDFIHKIKEWTLNSMFDVILYHTHGGHLNDSVSLLKSSMSSRFGNLTRSDPNHDEQSSLRDIYNKCAVNILFSNNPPLLSESMVLIESEDPHLMEVIDELSDVVVVKVEDHNNEVGDYSYDEYDIFSDYHLGPAIRYFHQVLLSQLKRHKWPYRVHKLLTMASMSSRILLSHCVLPEPQSLLTWLYIISIWPFDALKWFISIFLFENKSSVSDGSEIVYLQTSNLSGCIPSKNNIYLSQDFCTFLAKIQKGSSGETAISLYYLYYYTILLAPVFCDMSMLVDIIDNLPSSLERGSKNLVKMKQMRRTKLFPSYDHRAHDLRQIIESCIHGNECSTKDFKSSAYLLPYCSYFLQDDKYWQKDDLFYLDVFRLKQSPYLEFSTWVSIVNSLSAEIHEF